MFTLYSLSYGLEYDVSRPLFGGSRRKMSLIHGPNPVRSGICFSDEHGHILPFGLESGKTLTLQNTRRKA